MHRRRAGVVHLVGAVAIGRRPPGSAVAALDALVRAVRWGVVAYVVL
jgi:hypothetical protein